MSSASIVVPVYNALEYARDCIESIYAAETALPFEVIVVDNGSKPEVGAWLADEARRRANFRYLRFDKPLGFPRAANEGARAAGNELLVLLNSDTVVYDGWLDLLAASLTEDRAIAAPVTGSAGLNGQTDAAAPARNVLLGREYAASIHGRDAVDEPQRLVFFCAMIRREVWTELGGLDEGYGEGNYEDDEFCLRARLAGYRMALARNVFVLHHGHITFDENRVDHAETMARNRLRFVERAVEWSKTPRAWKSARRKIDDVTVIVPAPEGMTQGLRDSLASMANQTVTGFDVVVVSTAELPDLPGAIRQDGSLAALLNAGIEAARGRRVAFLPAGDIYYPFHLEILAAAEGESAFTAWSVAAGGGRGALKEDEISPDRLPAYDMAPLVCWMHANRPRLDKSWFDESLDGFCGWDWVMRLRKRPQYIQRMTCEKTAQARVAAEADRLMAEYPVAGPWFERERKRFAGAVRTGMWERAMIVGHRAPQLRAAAGPTVGPTAELAAILLFSIIPWTDLTQRPHHFARGLAARGYRVYWIDVRLKDPAAKGRKPAMRLAPNLHYVELPGEADAIYRLWWREEAIDAMAAALAELDIGDAVQLVNFPKWTPLVLRLRQRFGWRVVYDCLDDQQAFGELHRGNAAELEYELVREADRLITSGKTLYERFAARHPILISNAADFDLFASARPGGQLARMARPVIGFFGAFAEWLDLDWIAAAARRFPEWTFVYIGREGFASAEAKAQWQRAVAAPNIHVMGQVDLRTLAGYLAEFDVCTMPFRDIPITRSMNAVKIYEYLAAGKPVVARDLPETRPLAERGLIATYGTDEESFGLLERASAGGMSGMASAGRAFAAENTWRRRIDELTKALDELTNASGPLRTEAAPVPDTRGATNLQTRDRNSG